jgi:HD-like signal output (HDOD) protein
MDDNCSNPEADDAFAAGLLLDVGLLVLATHEPGYLADLLLTAEREGQPMHDIETDRHDITHAEIGALWGLPHTIVEAVAHHHRPLRPPIPSFDAIAITHIADALVADTETGPPDAPTGLSRIDRDYLDRIGVTDRIADRQRLATTQLTTT